MITMSLRRQGIVNHDIDLVEPHALSVIDGFISSNNYSRVPL